MNYLFIYGTCNITFVFGPAPGTLVRVKRTNIIKFQLQSQFQRFLYQTLCVLSQMKDKKTYHTAFLFCRLGHALGGDIGVLVRQKLISVLLFVKLSPTKPLDEIQPNLVCELLT